METKKTEYNIRNNKLCISDTELQEVHNILNPNCNKNWLGVLHAEKVAFIFTILKDCDSKAVLHSNICIYKALSSHRKFKLRWLLKLPDKDWDFDILSQNSYLKLEIIILYADKWNYKILSSHHKFNFNWFLKLPDKPWDFNRLSVDTNLKLNIIVSYPDKWNYKLLSINPVFANHKLTNEKVNFFRQNIQKMKFLQLTPDLQIKILRYF